MHFSAVALAIAAAAVGSTSASSVAPRALVSLNHASSALLSRQVATACVATCTPVQNEVTTCGVDPTCLCTPSLANELLQCANCRLSADATLRDQLETAWDQYSSGCASLGRPVSGSINGNTGATTTTPGVVVTPSVIATPTTTTTPAVVFTPSPIATSAAGGFSAAPAASSSSAASSSGNNSDSGGLVAHSNSASTVRVGGALGVFIAGVVAALL